MKPGDLFVTYLEQHSAIIYAAPQEKLNGPHLPVAAVRAELMFISQ